MLSDGTTYDLSGVNPNVVVCSEVKASVSVLADTPSTSTNAPKTPEGAEKDAVLDRAMDILLGLKALGTHAAGQTANPKN